MCGNELLEQISFMLEHKIQILSHLEGRIKQNISRLINLESNVNKADAISYNLPISTRWC